MLFNQQPTTSPLATSPQALTLKKAATYGAAFAFAGAVLFIPEVAMAGGLDKATNGLQQFMDDMKPFIRIFAVVALMLTAAGYMAGMVDKSKFILIVAGLLIIGAAPDIVDMFWSK